MRNAHKIIFSTLFCCFFLLKIEKKTYLDFFLTAKNAFKNVRYGSQKTVSNHLESLPLLSVVMTQLLRIRFRKIALHVHCRCGRTFILLK